LEIEKQYQKSYLDVMQTNFEILELFPTPVFTTILPLELSKITPWLFKQEVLSEKIDSANYGERSKNSYILDEPQAIEVKNYILAITTHYGKLLGYDYDSYRFGQSWISYKHPGQHHTRHSHSNSLISGVFYFGEPTEGTPAIKFHKSENANIHTLLPKLVLDKRDLKYAQKEFSIEFTPGLLLLFPSCVQHSVPLNKTDKTRCSLAFNVVPTVGLGEEASLTELKF
jgi:uncharacterized protein (TIGR02466 family)